MSYFSGNTNIIIELIGCCVWFLFGFDYLFIIFGLA